MTAPTTPAAAELCRGRVLDLLRQGWTFDALAACCELDVETLAAVVTVRPVSWRTCEVVGDVFRELDGALRRYREVTERRRRSAPLWVSPVSHTPLGRAS